MTYCPRRLVAVLACLVLALVSLGLQDHVLADGVDGASEAKKTDSSEPLSERVKVLLDTLRSEDQEEALRAQQELLKVGWEAIPQIEQRLKSSDAGVFYRLIQQIKSLHSPSRKQVNGAGASRNTNWFSIDEKLADLKQWLNDTSPPKNEKPLLKRFRDAVERYRNGEPRRGLMLAKALLIVAPDASFSSKLRRFIRACQERIFNESTIQANLKTDKVRYAWRESISLTFRVKNVSGKPVTLHFEPPDDRRRTEQDGSNMEKRGEKQNSQGRTDDGSSDQQNGNEHQRSDSGPPGNNHQSSNKNVSEDRSENTILLEFEHEKIGVSGNSTRVTGYREYDAPKQVQLSPGSTWEKTVTFDTSSFTHRYVLRRFSLQARVTPTFVDVGNDRMLRWIAFGRTSFELFPRGMRESRPVTVEKIKRHLKAGNFRDVFFMTVLLSSKQRDPVVKFFLRVLPFLKRGNARTIMFLLRELTGEQFYYNREKWLNWGRDTYDVDARPPETNEKSPPIPIYDN